MVIQALKATTLSFLVDKKIEIKLNPSALRQVHLSAKSIADILKEKEFNVKERENSIILHASELSFKELYKLKEKLKKTIVSGVKGIVQVLIVKRERDYVILTAGTNLNEILKIKGVDKNNTITNDIYEIRNEFGIEAARNAIINEINGVIHQQGLDIDIRHLRLVADAMTSTGEIKGVTRMGIISQKSSILARASFETPVKQFVNATVKGSRDKLTSVVENIIINQPVPVGTGLPGLLVKVTGPLVRTEEKIKRKKEA